MASEESQVYRDLMRLRPEGMTLNAWAVSAGVSRTVWTDMRRHGNPSRRTLERLLSIAGSSLAEFEMLRIGASLSRAAAPNEGGVIRDPAATKWRGASLPPIPVLGTALAGEWGDAGIELLSLNVSNPVDQLARPTSLANDRSAFAITIVGVSMSPRFRPGRLVAISPVAPVSIGDDVLVELCSSPVVAPPKLPVLVGELVRRTSDHAELRQFRPEVIFRVPCADIRSIRKIPGELI